MKKFEVGTALGSGAFISTIELPRIPAPDSKEYERSIELKEDYYFLMEAKKRLKENEGKERISMEEIMESCGISQEDLDAIEDEVIE